MTIENRVSIRANIADMKRIVSLCVFCLASTLALAEPEDEVRCREISFSKSAEQRDFAAFRSHIDDDARFVAATVRRGVDNIAEGWTVFFTADGPTIKWRPQFIEVLENGTLALSRGPYRVTTNDAAGNTVENWGTFNSIWRLNDDGQWRVVFDAGSPAASEPDDATRTLLDQEDACP